LDCSATTRATSRCTRLSRTTCGLTRHGFWQHGKKHPFFLPVGAEAFRRNIPGAKIQFFDTGQFALETHAKEIATVIRNFFASGV
jgi:hypothetical protein